MRSSPLGHVTHATYDKAGEPIRVTDPTGRFQQYGYDLAGRQVSTVAGQGSSYASPIKVTGFDLAGRAVSTMDCEPTTTGACGTVLRQSTSVFDGAGRPIQSTSAAGRITTYGYDPAGLLSMVSQRQDPTVPTSAITVQLGYDTNGNNTRLVDGDGNATVYTYTPWNQPESTIEPATVTDPNPADRTWTTVYDAAGRAVQEQLPGGVTRTGMYDHLGRLTAETATGATTTTAAWLLDYDALSHIVLVGSPAGNNTFTYNDRGLLVHATGYGGGATFGYDADGNLTSQQNAAGTATFGYDDAGRISSTVDPFTATTAHTSYDAAGRIEAIDLGATHAGRTYTYDTLGRTITDETTRPDGSVSMSTTYGYDRDDLPTTKQTAGLAGAGANSYGYDGLGRLTTWTTNGQTTSYGYDSASNRTTVTTSTGTRTSTFDTRNRLVSTTGAGQPTDSYTWNSRGQLTNATIGGQSTTYTFDGFERLVQMAKSGGTTTTYAYDSLNRPAQRNGHNFGYTDLTDNAVISPAGSGETTILRDPTGEALATRTGSDPARLIRDDPVHGDVVATIDPATGNPTASATYTPWGTPSNSNGTLPLGYQGAFTDPDTGLVAAQTRWYNPESGSFASRDTVGLPVDPTPQTNRYLYGNASPLYLLDPTGHWPEWMKNAWGAVTDYTSWWWSSFQSGLRGQQPTAAAPSWVSTVNNWVDTHHADIVEGLVGAIAFAACDVALGAPTAGVGAVAGAATCGAFAGDLGGLAGQAVRCKEHQADDACTAHAFSAAAGAGLLAGLVGGGVGAGAGRLLGRGLTGQADSALRRLMVGLVGGGAGAAGGGASGGVLGAIGYAGNCEDTCSWRGLASAAGQGAEHGAELGAIFGVLGSAFGNSCTHSFAPDTRVLLADGGTKAIKDVAVNDQVVATDPIQYLDQSHQHADVRAFGWCRRMGSATVRRGYVRSWVNGVDPNPVDRYAEHADERASARIQVVEAEYVSRAMAAATALAGELHLRVDDAVVLHNSNKLALRLLPCGVFARVALVGQEVAALEVELALRLAGTASPVAALEPRVEPRVYERDCFVVTLWTYYEVVAPEPDLPGAYADVLQRLHTGMRSVEIATPHFLDRVAEAERLVTHRDETPALPEADRHLLLSTLRSARERIHSRGAAEQLLHGEPHPGNLLSTHDGLLFIDFETCCRGPIEFDVAHVPEEVSGRYSDVDQVLLAQCRRLVLAMVAAWRWDIHDEFPDGHRHGRDILSLLRQGPPWPALGTLAAE